MRICIATGGSGGHIYPALTLAKALEDKGHTITFIGSLDRMEKDVIPNSGFKFIGLDIKTTRGGLIQKFKSLFSLIDGYFKCKKILKDNYDMVIGFGNYISVPVVLAAKSLKLKIVIHEQNSFVGRANRMLDKKADLIIVSYSESLKQFQNPNKVVLGNPQSSLALNVKEDKTLIENLGLDSNKKVVLMFLGSLGSESVQKVFLEYFKMLDNPNYQIIYATGSKHFASAKDYSNNFIKVVEKVEGAKMMKNCDLLVSRAGATTIAEIVALGTASILIPSPYVPNNHQYYNAMALVNENAALILQEKDLDALSLKKMIEETLDNEGKLNRIRENARLLSNDHVLEDIVDRIENLWKQ